MDPTKAASGTPRPKPAAAVPKTITRTAPAEAPEEAPRRNGSASGLRTRAWSTVPATASPAPTTAPRRTRGIRTSHTMEAKAPVGRFPDRPPTTMSRTRPGAIRTGPSARPAIAETASAAARTTRTAPVRSLTRGSGGAGSPAIPPRPPRGRRGRPRRAEARRTAGS